MAKAESKTKATEIAVADYIAALPDARRRDEAGALDTLHRRVTGLEPKMWGPSIVGFDRYHYKYASGREGDMLLAGFSPRKQNLVLYVGPGLEDKGLLAKLGKHKTGKGCLYLKTLDDVDRTVLRALVEKSVLAMRERYPRE